MLCTHMVLVDTETTSVINDTMTQNKLDTVCTLVHTYTLVHLCAFLCVRACVCMCACLRAHVCVCAHALHISNHVKV